MTLGPPKFRLVEHENGSSWLEVGCPFCKGNAGIVMGPKVKEILEAPEKMPPVMLAGVVGMHMAFECPVDRKVAAKMIDEEEKRLEREKPHGKGRAGRK